MVWGGLSARRASIALACGVGDEWPRLASPSHARRCAGVSFIHARRCPDSWRFQPSSSALLIDFQFSKGEFLELFKIVEIVMPASTGDQNMPAGFFLVTGERSKLEDLRWNS